MTEPATGRLLKGRCTGAGPIDIDSRIFSRRQSADTKRYRHAAAPGRHGCEVRSERCEVGRKLPVVNDRFWPAVWIAGLR
jgi:hypothetical protein